MKKNYKDTLNLAESAFAMRGNLPTNEPKVYEKWQNDDIFATMGANRTNATEFFTLHDGPPYANGHLHIGHALNKILKDIVVKYHYFQGKRVFYTPGWDCHGLPIEQQVEIALGKDKKDAMPKKQIRALCREHAKKFVSIQSEEFQHFGILGDFKNPYKTMDFTFEADIYRCLCKIAQQGLLSERSKPIYWSWACKTALADAEVEYKDKESDSIFVTFEMDESAKQKLGVPNAKAVIWTTTPWTLPANQAIALNPNEIYVITSEGYIFAKKLLENMVREGITKGEVVREFESHFLEETSAINPLNGRESKILFGEHVQMDNGSGLVHSAPGHGEDDYFVCRKFGIEEVLMPVDDRGCFDESLVKFGLLKPDVVSEFVGMHIFKAQPKLLILLGENLLKHSKITHSYPHCWRSHEPVIYRATKQWFILMDKPFFEGKTLRQIALEEIEKINFYPKSGYNRLKSMIENRPDWCISRQRDWGVPLAFFRDKKSGEVVLDSRILNFVAESFEREGCDIWWSKKVVDLLPPLLRDRADELEKCDNILDVWFDSGSTWSATLSGANNSDSTNPPPPMYNAGNYPADIYLEGSDQHRGWFQSSLLVSCAINHKTPFKNILTHGFTVDDNGEKMSKSKGNVVAPQSVLKEYGSEILRLWVALSDYQSDLKISKNILKQIAEQYRKIRNSLRFILANTNDLKAIDLKALGEIDRWILNEANNVLKNANALFGEYEFSKAYNVVMSFISNELSGVYFDLTKDILYCDRHDSKARVGIQTTLCVIARKLFAFLAPVLTYTINEAIECASPTLKGDLKSVFDCKYEDLGESFIPSQNFALMAKIRESFGVEIDKLKKDKVIKSALELEISVESNVSIDGDILASLLIVSGVKNHIENPLIVIEIDDVVVKIAKSNAFKCERCWRYLAECENGLCNRCKAVVGE